MQDVSEREDDREVKPWVEAELNRREFLKSVLGSFTPNDTPDLKN